MILVVGAAEPIGGAVVDELLGRGVPVRATAGSEAAAAALRERGVEAFVADLADPATLARPLVRVEHVFVAEPPSPGQLEREQNLYAVAEQSGAYRVVRVATPGHDPAADALRATSLRWTLLQADERADPRDVAALAAQVLAEEGHDGASYVVG